MNAAKLKLLEKLIGQDNRQFVIPIYQRKYKWTIEQCNRLLDDIVKAGTSKHEHFFGTIVYQRIENGTFNKEQLVDGQQRITTIMLILKSLQILCMPYIKDDKDFDDIYNEIPKYIFADKDDSSKGFKLILGESDKEIFNIILSSNTFDDIKNNSSIYNFNDNYIFN